MKGNDKAGPVQVFRVIGLLLFCYFLINLFFMCVSVQPAFTSVQQLCLQCPQTLEEDVASPGTGVRESCEPPHVCWELKSGPLEEQPVLLLLGKLSPLILLFLIHYHFLWKKGFFGFLDITVKFFCIIELLHILPLSYLTVLDYQKSIIHSTRSNNSNCH